MCLPIGRIALLLLPETDVCSDIVPRALLLKHPACVGFVVCSCVNYYRYYVLISNCARLAQNKTQLLYRVDATGITIPI
jgi:hypothetical protein